MRFFALSLLCAASFLQAGESFQFPVGLDNDFETMDATLADKAVLDPNREKSHVLIVSDKKPASLVHDTFLVSWAPLPASATFPPEAKSYVSADQYLWRWIAALGPDAVVTENDALREALKETVPAFKSIDELPATLKVSPARAELQKRAGRSPIEVAEALLKHYGHRLNKIAYQPGLAIVGRNRLAKLKGEDVTDELRALVEKAPPLDNISNGGVSGHLIHAELGLKEAVIAAADAGLKNPGHNEMSDSVFMICPLVAAAGKFSGDEQYFKDCVAHLEKIQGYCLREDGIYRHSPLDEAAWGRGNGFPALGLAWTLSEMPESFAGQKKVVAEFQKHIAALAKHQDASGMWHQVVDHPGSYREFTSTCMITFAMTRGMRNGWLDRKLYEEPAAIAWEAIKQRISLDGKSFTDGCTGTGKQKSKKDYFLRTAILGPDERSGAMALMVSTERGLWDQEN